MNNVKQPQLSLEDKLVNALRWIISHEYHIGVLIYAFLMITFLLSITGYAQTGDGPITAFGRSDQDPLKGAKTFVNLLMWGMILAGIVGWCLGGINIQRDKPYWSRFVGGTICLGIGGFIALGDRIIKGDSIELPDLLGR
jgi:hypothetical protein